MKKLMGFDCEEKIEKETLTVEQGIYNGFGNRLIPLPSTQETKLNAIGFDTKEIGDMFIEMGNLIKKEQGNITNISLFCDIRENTRKKGKVFCGTFAYETQEKNKEEQK